MVSLAREGFPAKSPDCGGARRLPWPRGAPFLCPFHGHSPPL